MKTILFGILFLAVSAFGKNIFFQTNFQLLFFYKTKKIFFKAQHCNDPKFSDVKTFSSQDTKLNTETAYVVQFRVQCAGNAKNVPFFGAVNGNFLASSADESGERYEISWSEPTEKARSGEVVVRIYDEEGFSAYKKAQRTNGDLSKVKELKSVSFYHQGAYRGPSVQSELLVTVLFGAVFYWAQSIRNKIQAQKCNSL